MTWFPFRPQAAVNILGQLVRTGSGRIYAVTDTSFSSPLPTRQIGGGAVLETIAVNDFITQAFEVEDHPEVMWRSSTLPAIQLISAKGMRDATEAAATAATSAATSAETAATAAGSAAATTDTVMAARIADPESATRPAMDDALDDLDVLKGTQHRSPRTGVPDALRVRDSAGRVGFAVDEDGVTHIGSTAHVEGVPGLRVADQAGRMAFEIDKDGRTHIYDLVTTGADEVTTLHVFVLAGQSNMSGRGLPVEAPTSPRVMQYGANNRTLETAPIRLDMVDNPSGTSPASFFAHNYLASQPPHVGVLLIPAARGGTAFAGSPGSPAASWTWVKGAAPSPEFALYERSVEQTQEAIVAAKGVGYQTVLKAVLWHQGEGNGGQATATYAARLDALIADYRTDLGDPALPFVVGQMCPEGMVDTPAKYTVDTAHQDTPARTTRTGFAAATWDGHNEGDTTHFSTVGTAYLGDTYLTGYIQALGNVHP